MLVLFGVDVESFEHVGDFFVFHEDVPAEAGAVIFHHGDDGAGVDCEEVFGVPILCGVECVVEAEGTPELLAVGVVEVFHGGDGFFGGVGHGAECGGGGDGAVVATGDGCVCFIAFGVFAGGESPDEGGVVFELAGVFDAVGAVDEGHVFVVFKVVGELVGDGVGVEAEVGVVCEEEWTAGAAGG